MEWIQNVFPGKVARQESRAISIWGKTIIFFFLLGHSVPSITEQSDLAFLVLLNNAGKATVTVLQADRLHVGAVSSLAVAHYCTSSARPQSVLDHWWQGRKVEVTKKDREGKRKEK